MFKYSFAASLAALLICSTTVRADLVSHWKLDGNADDSAGARDGTLVGGVGFSTDTAPSIGSTFSLDTAAGQRMTYDVLSGDSVSGSYTISVWANIDDASLAGSQTFFGTRSPGEMSFDVKFRNSGSTKDIHGDIGDGSAWIDTSADAVFDFQSGTWHHVLYTVDGSGYTLYADGGIEASESFTGSPVPLLFDENHDIAIGAFRASGGEDFNGKIDDVGVFDRVLSEGEAKAIFDVSTVSALEFDLSDMAQLFAVANQDITEADVDGMRFFRTTGLTTPVGEFVVDFDGKIVVNFGGGIGVTNLVPEPSSAATFLLGGWGMIAARRRRRPARNA